MSSRAERRRLERELAKGVELTPAERAGLRRFDRLFPGVLRRHFARFPVDVEQLERESDATALRITSPPGCMRTTGNYPGAERAPALGVA